MIPQLKCQRKIDSDIGQQIQYINTCRQAGLPLEFYKTFGDGSTFPQVRIFTEEEGEKTIGGCCETVKYLRENKLI